MITEHQHQAALIKWWYYQYPKRLIFAIPNGGTRNIKEAIKLKNEGVLAGVFDIFIPSLNLFLEMKNENGKLSQSQKEFQKNIQKEGYRTFVAYSFIEAKNYLIKLIDIVD